MGQGSEYKGSSRRIARNTLLLYFRQCLVLFVSLYTSRVILHTLGISDFGIYSLVGSFVAMFHVISGAFGVAVTRYMSIVIVKDDLSQKINLYSTSMWMQIIMGGIIFLMILCAGWYYVVSVMVMPVERVDATLYVLFFSAASFYVELLSVPYNALIVAHERMQAFAYIAIVEVLLKLAVVLILPFLLYDKLIAYGFMTVLVVLVVRCLYMWYCRRNFEECVFRWQMDLTLLKDMSRFVQWAFLGNGAVVMKEQGVSIILNLFLGTGINAARGISVSVNGAVLSFANSFIQAVQPQITKLYSSGQCEVMHKLICLSSRMSFYLLLLLSLPLIKQIDYILEVWLGQAPEFTGSFICLILVDSMIYGMYLPLIYGTLAEGGIKVYEICLTITYLASLPLTYWLLAEGHSPVDVYCMLIVIQAMIPIFLLWQGKRYGLRAGFFFRHVFFYIVPVALLAGGVAAYLDFDFLGGGWLEFAAQTAAILLASLILIVALGITGAERAALLSMIKKRLERFQGNHL